MELPLSLVQSLQARKIVPFVGAGVSMAVKRRETGAPLFPSWKQTLLNAAERLKREGKNEYSDFVKASLKLPTADFLNIAKQTKEALGPTWYTFLREQFDPPFCLVADSSLDLARSIWRLGGNLTITTNYDRVLQWACPNHQVLTTWDIEAPAEQVQFLQDKLNRPIVWHLHGHIQNAAEIIISTDGYNRLYAEGNSAELKYKAAIRTLQSVLASHNLLFIGFSLDDENLCAQLKSACEIFRGAVGPHYVLVHKKSASTLSKLSLPVQAIEFEDFGKPLEELLTLMAIEMDGGKGPLSSGSPNITLNVGSTSVSNVPFSVPYRSKGSQVIGRETALIEVRKQLTNGLRTNIGHTAAFQGFGGLGKTQLAVEYCYRFRAEYPSGVIWINADQDIDSQLIELADKTQWVPPDSANTLKLITARNWLRNTSDCLIVFDNVVSLDHIKNYLPTPGASPHVLMTSRLTIPGFEAVPLGLLDPNQSLELLFQEAGKKPESNAALEAAKTVAEKLDGLPLALELAGAYLRNRDVTWNRYLELFANNFREALPGKFLGSFTQHERDLYSTLKINEELFHEEPRLKDILDLLTWSATAPMGRPLMGALLNVGNEHKLTGALGLGTKLRIIQKAPNSESYSVHRLIQEVRRAEFPIVDRKPWVNEMCERAAEWFHARKRNFADLHFFEAEVDHLQAWQKNSLIGFPQHSVKLLWLQAYPAHHRGRNDEALAYLQQAIALYEANHLEDPLLKAHLLNDVGTTLMALDQREPSLKPKQESLEIRLKHLGEEHTDTAMSLHNLAMFFLVGQTPGDVEKAASLLKRAYEVWNNLNGEEHVDTSMALTHLGAAYAKLHRPEGFEYLEKGLSIRKRLFGERHPETATAFHELGINLVQSGRGGAAGIDYLKKALSLRREFLGEQHAKSIWSLRCLVNALCKEKKQHLAELVLKDYLEKLPKNHPKYDGLKRVRKGLFDGVIRPGFRQKPKRK